MDPDSTTHPRYVHAPQLAERLTELMERLGLSGNGLAKCSKVNKETINNWRYGRSTWVQVEKVEKLAASLGVGVHELLGDASAQLPAEMAPHVREQVSVMAERLAEQVEQRTQMFLTDIKHLLDEARSQEPEAPSPAPT